MRELRYQLGLSRGRLELTERAESSLREDLKRERRRAEEERARADQERARVEELRAELERARRPWWRRVFGGE